MMYVKFESILTIIEPWRQYI